MQPQESAKSPPLPRLRSGLPLVGTTLGIMRDPIAFQRRGHRKLGPVFEARLFNKRLVFVDPIHAPELLEKIVRAPTESLSMVSRLCRRSSRTLNVVDLANAQPCTVAPPQRNPARTR